MFDRSIDRTVPRIWPLYYCGAFVMQLALSGVEMFERGHLITAALLVGSTLIPAYFATRIETRIETRINAALGL